jgi:hypothetical protein
MTGHATLGESAAAGPATVNEPIATREQRAGRIPGLVDDVGNSIQVRSRHRRRYVSLRGTPVPPAVP